MYNKYYKISAIIVMAVAVIGIILVLLPWPVRLWPLRQAQGRQDKLVEFEIARGQTLGQTARLLAEQDLISSRLLFVIHAILTGQEKKFKAGTYMIKEPVSIGYLVNMFSRGLSEPDDISVTIPEGMNLADIDATFSKAGLIQKGDLLGSENLKYEGSLFPDTYRFPKDSLDGSKLQADDIVQKMEDNFKLKTQDLFSNLDDQKIKEVITVASLLEKEVRTPSDMHLVAGIIEKRAAKKMPLAIDATVAYGVCYPKFVLKQYCDTSLADIIDNLGSTSDFNTYKKAGLPPAPISNPGLAAIQAALNPQPSDFLYYLNAKDGTTIFSKTAAEHEAARRKYLR